MELLGGFEPPTSSLPKSRGCVYGVPILGHSQLSATLDIYTHTFDKNKKAASAELQGMLEI